MSPEAAPKALRTVAREKAFYFFTSIGNYTGVSASSLKEFVDRINEVNVRSLEFHVNRGDFEKWVNEVLEDSELAGEIKKLQKSNLAGEDLRSQVYMTFLKRLKRLTGQVSPSYF